MLRVYTAQYRYSGDNRLDITAKTGESIFAPSWDMVWGLKKGKITEEQYTKAYRKLMELSIQKHPEAWKHLLSRDTVVLVCFCAKGQFCHRILLAQILEELGAKYMGEI